MKRIFLSMMGLLCAPQVWASETVSLQVAVQQALQHAPALQAEQAARDAAQENKNLGKAQLLPYVAVSGSLNRQKQQFVYDIPNAFLRTNVNSLNSSYGIQLAQPLFDLSKWALYKQGELGAISADLKLAIKRQQTILQTASAWLDVMRSKAALDAAKHNEQAMQDLTKKARIAFQVGLSSMNDSLAAQSRSDLARAARIRAESALLQAQSTLNSLLGHTVAINVHIADNFHALMLHPNTLHAWQEHAEQQSLTIALAHEQADVFDNQYTEALGNAMPKVQLVAGWNRNQSTDGTFGGSSVKTSMIGIEVNAPLYAGGALSAKRRQVTQQKVQAEYQIAEAKRSTRLSIQQTWLALQSNLAELSALKQAKKSAQQALKASQVGLEVGLRTLNDVMDSEQRLASTQESYADALARYAMTWLQLHATAGHLQSTDLKALDDLLNEMQVY